MNPAHLHLMLNHVPVLAVPFGLAVLGWAMFRPRPEFARLALIVFVFSALATIPTYLTGEPAEDAIEGVAGAIEPWIEPHEEAALVSLVLGEALGVLWATPASRATGTFSAIASPCRFRREVCNSR
jgi:hypothetical protein